ncbi:Protein RRP5-like protein [Acropora cervicornis]|uniref:Protein RRP5-like protein n=1 Tax=Acropora cervicornis TaxID=6130 RepID=A0AAD9VFA6_ACRCE|nr:Protein RRP5-like protein [Acropora cervicornis]
MPIAQDKFCQTYLLDPDIKPARNSSLQSRFQSETKTKKQKKTLKTKSDDDDKFLGQLKQRRVEFLTFKTCFPGLHKYFKVGSLVQCNVLEMEVSDQGQRKVKLSLDPKEVNSSLKKSSLKQGMVVQGYVSSVEDHGYLISFGIEDTRAFLPKKNLTRDFQEGHPLSVLLKSVAEQNRIITVSIDEKEIEQAMDVHMKWWPLWAKQACLGGLSQLRIAVCCCFFLDDIKDLLIFFICQTVVDLEKTWKSCITLMQRLLKIII